MSIKDDFIYLNTTKKLLRNEINRVNNVLDDNSTFRSYPQELFNGYLDILNNGTDTLWSNLEKVSQIGTEAVLENVENAPMKIELSGNTSQDGTPTPDSPVDIEVVKGENVVSVSGKNLFDKENTTWYRNNDAKFVWKNNVNTTRIRTNSFKIEGGKTYVVSGVPNGISLTAVRTYEDDTPTGVSTGDVTRNETVFTLGQNVKYIHLLFGGENFTDDTNVMMKNANIQLEEGSTATEYQPFSKTDYPINLGDIELCKIKTYKDYFHKDNGSWYVHKEIEKVVLDGSESWSYISSSVLPFRTSISDMALNSTGSATYNFFSNYYKAQSGSVNDYAIGQISGVRAICIRNVDISTLEDFKTWLSTHNTIVYYVLATPTETEITNTTLIEQLEAISKAKSVKEKTYISQTNDELPFVLDVEAIKEYEVN